MPRGGVYDWWGVERGRGGEKRKGEKWNEREEEEKSMFLPLLVY